MRSNNDDESVNLQRVAFQNIHFVSSTMHATREIVDSIEKDVMDIKTTIRNREQDRLDREQLIALLRTENQTLQTKLGMVERELIEERTRWQQEQEERVLAANAEVERVLDQCNQALEDRHRLTIQTQRLEEENAHLHNQIHHLHQQNDHLLKLLEGLRQHSNATISPAASSSPHQIAEERNDRRNGVSSFEPPHPSSVNLVHRSARPVSRSEENRENNMSIRSGALNVASYDQNRRGGDEGSFDNSVRYEKNGMWVDMEDGHLNEGGEGVSITPVTVTLTNEPSRSPFTLEDNSPRPFDQSYTSFSASSSVLRGHNIQSSDQQRGVQKAGNDPLLLEDEEDDEIERRINGQPQRAPVNGKYFQYEQQQQRDDDEETGNKRSNEVGGRGNVLHGYSHGYLMDPEDDEEGDGGKQMLPYGHDLSTISRFDRIQLADILHDDFLLDG
eukprot:gene3084-3372_t